MYDAIGEPEAQSIIASSPIAGELLAWYERHRRVLPWRALPGMSADPYAVWLSEIMLQQTTVTAVKPYYEAFLARWPDVRLLAAADVQSVMQQWAGLGYYSRARNLHLCAKMLVERHGGSFPSHEAGLRALPGIGPYTAAAIAAIAFGQRAVVVDGNVERVIARLFAIANPLPGAKALIRSKADEVTPAERPGDFAQAMMDLGATICTPKRPSCTICPLLAHCAAAMSGTQESFPVKAPKQERPLRFGAAFYLRRADGAVLVRTRAAKGLLGGMTEIPGTLWSEDFDLARALREAPIEANYRKLDAMVEHVFTHFALRLCIYVAAVAQDCPTPPDCRWTRGEVLDNEALPSVMRKIVKAARQSMST
ncbi:MAG TPA: A/G-specific adenine glycosylase [Beijerinckia sp.]|jgi:A/G-specific adenine glycosylase|nr:A/G-specific adenine glycosylase [Beijerinckia sp.]